MDEEEIPTIEKTTMFSDELTASDNLTSGADTTSSTDSNVKVVKTKKAIADDGSIVSMACYYCGKRINNVEIINASVKCPHCDRTF